MTNQERFEADLKEIGMNESRAYMLDHSMTGVIRRTPMGHLCGYVSVPEGLRFDAERYIVCHGGVTYEGKLPKFEGRFIGFDCAHIDDWVPISWADGTYKDITFVLNEIREIANQLHEIKEK